MKKQPLIKKIYTSFDEMEDTEEVCRKARDQEEMGRRGGDCEAGRRCN